MIVKLERALATGALEVEDEEGKKVRFRSQDELFALKRKIEQDLGIAPQAPGGRRLRTTQWGKGL